MSLPPFLSLREDRSLQLKALRVVPHVGKKRQDQLQPDRALKDSSAVQAQDGWVGGRTGGWVGVGVAVPKGKL